MNSKQKLSLGFLILGLIFSSVIRVRFNVSNGFEFQGLWITALPSIFDFAALRSSDLALTSTFLGYVFLAISGLYMLSDLKAFRHKISGLYILSEFKAFRHKLTNLTTFLILTLLALVFESVSLIQDIFSSFTGQHLRIGLALFLFGLFILVKNLRTINKKQ